MCLYHVDRLGLTALMFETPDEPGLRNVTRGQEERSKIAIISCIRYPLNRTRVSGLISPRVGLSRETLVQ